jgi:uncharacterized membrane protein YhaH (DUF805 family)
MEWYLAVLKKYAVFSGRARRQEFWTFALISFVISVILGAIDGAIRSGGNVSVAGLSGLYSLAVLIPSLAVTVRRLHDTGRSGWWILIELIPLIGLVVLLFFLVQDSEPGPNQYGPNPKELPSGGLEAA